MAPCSGCRREGYGSGYCPHCSASMDKERIHNDMMIMFRENVRHGQANNGDDMWTACCGELWGCISDLAKCCMDACRSKKKDTHLTECLLPPETSSSDAAERNADVIRSYMGMYNTGDATRITAFLAKYIDANYKSTWNGGRRCQSQAAELAAIMKGYREGWRPCNLVIEMKSDRVVRYAYFSRQTIANKTQPPLAIYATARFSESGIWMSTDYTTTRPT